MYNLTDVNTSGEHTEYQRIVFCTCQKSQVLLNRLFPNLDPSTDTSRRACLTPDAVLLLAVSLCSCILLIKPEMLGLEILQH